MLEAVRLHGVTKCFDSTVAVEGLTFGVHPGEILVLLGPNGAGKTTTLRLIAGLLSPSAGQVWVQGQPMKPEAHPLRSALGLLPELPGFWERLTAIKNLTIYAKLYNVADPYGRSVQLLERFGLLDWGGRPVATFSKGMKQRLALARMLLHDPPILLLDEPTAGLDPEGAMVLRELLIKLRAEGKAILLSTHDLEEADRLGDRVAVLKGRLLALDTVQRLRERLFGHRVNIKLAKWQPALMEVAGALKGVAAVQAAGDTLEVWVEDYATVTPLLIRALVEAGADILSVEQRRPSMEELYLRVVREPGERGP